MALYHSTVDYYKSLPAGVSGIPSAYFVVEIVKLDSSLKN
jgi:hypothetical protein